MYGATVPAVTGAGGVETVEVEILAGTVMTSGAC